MQHKPLELRVDDVQQQDDVLMLLYKLSRQYADKNFMWSDLEEEVEGRFDLTKGSLRGELEQLQGPLLNSSRAYDAVMHELEQENNLMNEQVKKFPVKKTPKEFLKQTSKDLDKIYKDAKLSQETIGGKLRNIWSEKAIVPPIKDRKEAERKIRDKYNHDPSFVRDISRFTGKFNNFTDLLDGYKKFEELEGIKVLNIKNKFMDADVLGYRDININASYKLPNDSLHIFELQMNLSKILEVKEKVHVHYETIRSTIPKLIEGISTEEGNKIQSFVIDRLKRSQVEAAVEILREKAGGVFLYAHLLEKQLEEESKKDNKCKLDFTELKALPSGLKAFYETNLNRVFPKNTDDGLLEKGMDFMSLVCAAEEPLHYSAMKAIIGKSAYDSVKEKLSLLFPTGDDNCIHITHKSVRDYLLGEGNHSIDSNSERRTYAVSRNRLEMAHRRLCSFCFIVMGFGNNDRSRSKLTINSKEMR